MKLRYFKNITLVLLCMASLTSYAGNTLSVKSPDGKLKVQISLDKDISCNISSDDHDLLTCNRLGLELENSYLGINPRLTRSKVRSFNSQITPVIPLKYSSISNDYNELILSFKGGYSLEFRAYNEGIAYRFVTTLKDKSLFVINESFNLHFPLDYTLHLQQPGNFKTAYEEAYTHLKSSEWMERDKMSTLPILIDTSSAYKILFAEANVSDYPRMFVKGDGKNGVESIFPKVPLEFGEDGDRSLKILKEAEYIAHTSSTREFPWRYFVIADRDEKLIENTMSCKLSPSSIIDDPSWIKPGQASWEWWNEASPYGADVNFVSGYNLDTYKYYIDFAAKFGIPYIIMDEGWALSTTDPYTPNPEVDVHEIIRYGKEKNVGVVLWLTWLTVENNFDLFKTFQTWGVKGVKIDFMDRSDQWMVNFYERVAQEAAKHKLFVDFHGSFTPAGLEYKYPNILSYEGVRGMEQMQGCYPDNSLFFPFIRNAVGAMDYTPGAMFSMQPDRYSAQRPNSGSIGTRAYQMALFVVFESGLQMLADNPTLYYRNEDCTKFITQVPVTWDETKALMAEIGQVAVVAKRKNSQWFIGGITNDSKPTRELILHFDFLDEDKTYTMTYFEDGINAGLQAMDYRKKEIQVKKGDSFTVTLVRNGGFAAVLE